MIIKNILIGEDIRQEVGNKISLMGILGSSLNIDIQSDTPKDTPVMLSFALLISIENTNQANDPKDYKVLISMSIGENKLVDMTARIESTGIQGISHLPVPRFELGVTETTRLSVYVQVVKNDTLVSECTAILDIILNRI